MTNKRCPSCAKDIPGNAPAGICPACLIQAGFNGNQSAATSPSQGNYSVPAADSLIGRFPNLEIEYLIGQGGMGAVYKARQTNLDRVVALKILSPQLGDDPTFAERFTREARTLAKLSHPNIVTVFDFGVTDSMHYLVMEYIDGVNLRETILATDYSPTEALAVIGQICDALQYAHDAGVVHRDIKPENILVDRSGVVKIADFGLAKLLTPTPDEFTLTGTRQVLGTLKYMAPEQIEKPEQVDHRADLYSLGVVFYELLTGELPIGRFAVPSSKAQINHRLDDVVLKTLEKEPDQRYQQASEIKTAVAAASVAAQTQATSPVPESAPVNARSLAVPFTTDDIYGGMANGFGIARLTDPETLRVEIEVRDCFGAAKLSLKSVDISVEDLSSVRYRSGFFKDKITIQADSMTIIGEIPSATHGCVNLYTKKADAPLAKRLTMDIHNRLPSSKYVTAPFAHAIPTAPVKQAWNAETDDDYLHVTRQLRVPMVGLFITALLYLVCAVFNLLAAWAHANQMETVFDQYRMIFGPMKIDGSIYAILISVCMGLILTATSWQLWRKKNYWLTMAGLILACIPVYPLTVISFVFGLWGLAMIDQPTAREVFHGPKKRLGLSHFLWALAFFLPLIIMLGAFVLYWRSVGRMPEPKNTKVTEQLESASDDGSISVTAEQNAAPKAEAVSEGSPPSGTVAPASGSPDAARTINNPGDDGNDSSALNYSSNYKLIFLLLAGLVTAIGFLMILGLVLYLILGKPQPI